jgi:ribulose-phosphate 3-epimerase
LVFTGKLGFNGGEFQAENLTKVAELRQLNPSIEIGVDGGITPDSAQLAIAAGVDVLNTGSYIHNAKDPRAAYSELVQIAEGA